MKWWLVVPPAAPPVIGPIANLRSELSASHDLGADALTPHTGEGAIERERGIHLVNPVNGTAVERAKQPSGIADRGIERHIRAGRKAIEGDIQVVDASAGHGDGAA